MKKLYPLLVLCACLCGLRATAQNWRPFRPNGDVHAFRGASADTILTLRIDSAGVSGGDSVYYFNRIMRRANSFSWQKSRNNQFGQQLRYNAAQRTYALFWNGGPATQLILDRALLLKPFARLGDTWSSAFTDYGVQTTLVSRGTMLLDGAQDSVATFRVGSAPGLLVVLSKNNGLVSGPVDLLFGVPGAKLLTLVRRPAPAGLSYYNPLTLLDLQPGDELGYRYEQFTSSYPLICASGALLRRVVSRQLTPDSIVYELQAQSRTTRSGAPGCGTAMGTVLSPLYAMRIAASRRTGQWHGDDRLKPLRSPLLSYAYERASTGSILMGYPVVNTRPGVACGGPAALQTEVLYERFGIGYMSGLDALAGQAYSAAGVGFVQDLEYQLAYTRRTISGTVQTCGSRTDFATLLPVKAARMAATFQLYPNPAAETATLTLPAPARESTTIRVLDNLGRTVLRQQLAIGQSTTTLALQRLPSGLYIVEVQVAGEAPQQLRLQH